MSTFAELWGDGPPAEDGAELSTRDMLAHVRRVRPAYDRLPQEPVGPEERDFIQACVLHLVALGVPPTPLCSVLNVHWQTVLKWAKADVGYGDSLRAAREAGNEILADGLLSVHTKHFNPAMAKVEADNTKWVLGVRDRNTYGTKVEVTDSGSAGLIDVLKQAIARIPRPEAAHDLPALDLERGDFTEVIDIQELLS